MRNLAFVSALLAVMGSADAGTRTVKHVLIRSNHADGALGTARNSPDSIEFIGCKAVATRGAPTQGSCVARDSTGLFADCTTINPELIAQIRSIKGDSYLSFSWDDESASSDCTSIEVSSSSEYEPKAP